METLITILYILNFFLMFAVIFLERKNPTTTLAWLLVLGVLPSVGFVLYIIFSQNLSRTPMYNVKKRDSDLLNQILSEQLHAFETKNLSLNNPSLDKYHHLVHFHLNYSQAELTQDNSIEVFNDGREKFDDLLKHIRQATSFIHMQYYIFKDDDLGQEILNALTEKAKEGVEVRLIFDEIGSRITKSKSFKPLIEAGGEVSRFFPSWLKIFNLRINYRNHRKIVVIDGTTGYIGGFNVGNEYLGLDKKFGYWRDTHLRIEGSAVYSLEVSFLLDWYFSNKKPANFKAKYFPEAKPSGTSAIQVVTSGPDSISEQIKEGYIKMINEAETSIFIQTPYFIPDESLLTALKIAALSGIDVRLMIPDKPDHMFVYWATTSYVDELLEYGVKVYTYDNGFLHAKVLIIDKEIASVGTANFDVRSFKLNFEVNAFIYDPKAANKLAEDFEEDQLRGTAITKEAYAQRPLWIRIKQSISRLLSPIL